MPFKKGDTKPEESGRKPGTPNKTTEEMREWIRSILEKQDIIKDLAALDEEKRLKIIVELMEFVVPKPKIIEFSGEINAHNSQIKTIYAALQQQSEVPGSDQEG